MTVNQVVARRKTVKYIYCAIESQNQDVDFLEQLVLINNSLQLAWSTSKTPLAQCFVPMLIRQLMLAEYSARCPTYSYLADGLILAISIYYVSIKEFYNLKF